MLRSPCFLFDCMEGPKRLMVLFQLLGQELVILLIICCNTFLVCFDPNCLKKGK